MRISARRFLIVLLTLSPFQVGFAGPQLSFSGAVEPAFYTTGDYQGYVKSLSGEFWFDRHWGTSASIASFEFFQDRNTWFTSVKANIVGLEAQFRSKEWHRQSIQLGAGISRQHKRADETFVEIATSDSTIIEKFQRGYMNTTPDDSLIGIEDFRMRTAIRDANGIYRAGISKVRDYYLYGSSFHLTYSVRLIGDILAQVTPKVKYYPSEPLYVWSIGFGLQIPIIPD